MAAYFRDTYCKSNHWVLFMSTYNKLQNGTFLVALDLKKHAKIWKINYFKTFLEFKYLGLKPLLGLNWRQQNPILLSQLFNHWQCSSFLPIWNKLIGGSKARKKALSLWVEGAVTSPFHHRREVWTPCYVHYSRWKKQSYSLVNAWLSHLQVYFRFRHICL